MKKSDPARSRRWRSLPTTASRAAPVWQSGTAQATTREGYVGIRHGPFQSRHHPRALEGWPGSPREHSRRFWAEKPTPPNDGPTCEQFYPNYMAPGPAPVIPAGVMGVTGAAAVINRPVAVKSVFCPVLTPKSDDLDEGSRSRAEGPIVDDVAESRGKLEHPRKVLPHRPFSETDGDQLDDTDREAQPCNLLPSHVHVGSDPNVWLLRRMGWSVGTAWGITASHGGGRDEVVFEWRAGAWHRLGGRRGRTRCSSASCSGWMKRRPAAGMSRSADTGGRSVFPGTRPQGTGEYLTVHFTSRPVLAG